MPVPGQPQVLALLAGRLETLKDKYALTLIRTLKELHSGLHAGPHDPKLARRASLACVNRVCYETSRGEHAAEWWAAERVTLNTWLGEGLRGSLDAEPSLADVTSWVRATSLSGRLQRQSLTLSVRWLERFADSVALRRLFEAVGCHAKHVRLDVKGVDRRSVVDLRRAFKDLRSLESLHLVHADDMLLEDGLVRLTSLTQLSLRNGRDECVQAFIPPRAWWSSSSQPCTARSSSRTPSSTACPESRRFTCPTSILFRMRLTLRVLPR